MLGGQHSYAAKAEPDASPQMGSAELEVTQMVDDSEQTCAEAADERSFIAQSAGGSPADGYLLLPSLCLRSPLEACCVSG